MTRRLMLLVAVTALATAATAVLVVASDREQPPSPRSTPESSGLALLVVETKAGSLPVVIGSTGFGKSGALVVPPDAFLTVPGQGDATVREALELPPREAATAVGNLLGVWIEDHASIEADRLASLADAAGGVEVGGKVVKGDELVSALEERGVDANTAITIVLEALLAAPVEWSSADVTGSEHPALVVGALRAAARSRVVALQTDEVASGVFRATPDQVTEALVGAFGGPAEDAVPVIVLNGNGVPGIGELVAERILPGGFRVAISQNASTFDHLETLIVVGSPDDVALAERVRDLLGVGSVSVSVGSGIAPVTVVVGKDFTG